MKLQELAQKIAKVEIEDLQERIKIARQTNSKISLLVKRFEDSLK